MGLDLYCLLVILIVCALCWKWYDDEGPDAGTQQVSTQKASASSHSERADDRRKANIQQQ
jgi:hypothetical protein